MAKMDPLTSHGCLPGRSEIRSDRLLEQFDEQ